MSSAVRRFSWPSPIVLACFSWPSPIVLAAPIVVCVCVRLWCVNCGVCARKRV